MIGASLFTEKQQLAILIDPDKHFTEQEWIARFDLLEKYSPDLIFLGGSTLENDYSDLIIALVKSRLSIPIIAFPADFSHVHPLVDGVLFLSLISGRNPEYLIGQHVKYAKQIKESHQQIIPCGYLLLDGGKKSAVAKVSQTEAISQTNSNLVVSTALAGELLGMQCIYLEAGSGALNPVSVDLVKAVANSCALPLIVGGGVKSAAYAAELFSAGAQLVVVGNGFEENPNLLKELHTLKIAVQKKCASTN